MIDRRCFIKSIASASIYCCTVRSGSLCAQEQTDKLVQFDQLFSSISDSEIDESRSTREFDKRILIVAKATRSGQIKRSKRSDLSISARAIDLIVKFEVASQAVYTQKYSRPTWPKGNSGVTIGIGYDLGYSNIGLLSGDWEDFISSDSIRALSVACKITGQPASKLIPTLSTVEIPWDKAIAQFQQIIPYYAGETEYAFPNCGLLTPDAFGALVSLVYNRGGSMGKLPYKDGDQRAEMRTIRSLMSQKKFSEIPSQIRSMKRLWPSDKLAGLIARRELEARLFEASIS